MGRVTPTWGTVVGRKPKGLYDLPATILIKRLSRVVYRENQTFDRRQLASAWITRRETELREPGALERASRLIITVAVGLTSRPARSRS